MRLGYDSAARAYRAVLCLALSSAVLAGCARFDDSASSLFTTEPSQGSGQVKPNPPPTPKSTTPRPKGPCIDPDRAVVATCLDTTSGLIPLPDGNTALVAERRTGRILQVTADQKPVEIAQIPVDGSGDGGLLGIALSPSYDEDSLIYAYISTPNDNRLVRIAKGDVPKDILTGIPKGAVGNAGSLVFASPNELLLLTGDAGDPAGATNPATLGGKLLRITSPSPGATPPPVVALSGIGTAGGLCLDNKRNIWVTDRTATEDRLQRIAENGTLVSPAWTWPDHPGVAGCAAAADAVAISMTDAKALAVAPLDQKTQAVTAAPTLTLQNRYGMLNGAALGPDGMVWVATVNKSGGQPGPNDDRVIKIPVPAGGGSAD